MYHGTEDFLANRVFPLCTDKVRVLYDRSQPTARIVAKDREDLEEPLVRSQAVGRN